MKLLKMQKIYKLKVNHKVNFLEKKKIFSIIIIILFNSKLAMMEVQTVKENFQVK